MLLEMQNQEMKRRVSPVCNTNCRLVGHALHKTKTWKRRLLWQNYVTGTPHILLCLVAKMKSSYSIALRNIPLRLSKRQSLSPTTVLFRTTLTWTITLHNRLSLPGSNPLLYCILYHVVVPSGTQHPEIYKLKRFTNSCVIFARRHVYIFLVSFQF